MGSGCRGKSAKKKKLAIHVTSYIVEYGFHECNSNFGLLHEIILGVLDL
jgi:hypothetical protein